MLECVGTTFIYRYSPVRVKTGIAILPCMFESSVHSIVGLQFVMIEKKKNLSCQTGISSIEACRCFVTWFTLLHVCRYFFDIAECQSVTKLYLKAAKIYTDVNKKRLSQL